jgi:hypothetical protein
LLELGREAGDVKQQIQLNFGLPLNRRTRLKNLNPVYSITVAIFVEAKRIPENRQVESLLRYTQYF